MVHDKLHNPSKTKETKREKHIKTPQPQNRLSTKLKILGRFAGTHDDQLIRPRNDKKSDIFLKKKKKQN